MKSRVSSLAAAPWVRACVRVFFFACIFSSFLCACMVNVRSFFIVCFFAISVGVMVGLDRIDGGQYVM